MSYFTFEQAAQNPGIITHVPSTKVSWSTGRNVRFGPGYIKKTPGKTLLTTIPTQSPVRAMFTFKGSDGTVRTIVCSDVNIFAYTNDFGSYTDITPAYPPSSITANDAWQFALVGGMPVLSNGVDKIWKWPAYNAQLEDLSNAPTMAKCMANLQNRLLLGWILESSYEYPGRIRWSGVANPELWTLDKKSKSGRADLVSPSSSMDYAERIKAFTCIDKVAFIFTNRNIWRLAPAGKPYSYQLDLLVEGIGLIATRAITNARGVRYFTGDNDFYRFIPGSQPEPIGFPIRNAVFPNLNLDAVGTAFTFYLPDTKEVFFCVATGSYTTPDTAVIYNTEFNNWSFCDVNYLSHSYTWTENNTTWDDNPFGAWDSIDDTNSWNQSDAGIIPYNIVGNINGEILKLDDGNNDYYAGLSSAIHGRAETGDFVFSTEFIRGEEFRKTVNEILPTVKPQTAQTPLMVEVGVRDSLSDDIKWSKPMPYTIGVSRKVNFKHTGKYIRLRFSTEQSGDQWVMDGYSVKYFRRGKR